MEKYSTSYDAHFIDTRSFRSNLYLSHAKTVCRLAEVERQHSARAVAKVMGSPRHSAFGLRLFARGKLVCRTKVADFDEGMVTK